MGAAARTVMTLALAVTLLGTGSGRASEASPHPRVVVVKIDGLSQETVDRFIGVEDPVTGRPALPWIRRLFYDRGVRVANFYARGVSLSQPSWAILDTGQHSLVKGNLELDRRTGHYSDHLNTIALYYEAARFRRVYPESVEALDSAGVPLLSDAFRFEERDAGLQLLRRGTRWFDFLEIGLGPVKGPISERIGDFIVGVDFKKAFLDTTRRAFLESVGDPKKRYVDLYFPSIDEALHDEASDENILRELKMLDRIIGEAHALLEANGTADDTVILVVSDHGQTYDATGAYSHGVNLINYLARPELGAHNVLTRAAPLSSYEIAGSVLKPTVPGPSVTASPHSLFLADRPAQVTCAFDFDGNERVQMHLRDPDLNRLQILLRALREPTRSADERRVIADGALQIVERKRPAWEQEATTLRGQLAALGEQLAAWRREQIERERWIAERKVATALRNMPADMPIAPFTGVSKLNAVDLATDVGERYRELRGLIWQAEQDLHDFGAYLSSLSRRLAIRNAEELARTPADAIFPPRDLGAPLTLVDITAYPVGMGDLTLDAEGRLDLVHSFRTVDYLTALPAIRVRNAVRASLGAHPVEWVAARLPLAETARALREAGALSPEESREVTSALVVASRSWRAVLLERPGSGGTGEYRLIPVERLDADPSTGRLAMTTAPWREGLAFGLYEDPGFRTGDHAREAWLNRFHPDRTWLEAVHRTSGGLAVIGLFEAFSLRYIDAFERAASSEATGVARTLRRFEMGKRVAMETDLFVAAAPFWNFDLKDFNPYGNHGSFRRSSMLALLWISGGARTRVAPGPVVVHEPYDGLDFVPTALEAAGLSTNGLVADDLRRAGFGPYPGRIVAGAFRDEKEGPVASP